MIYLKTYENLAASLIPVRISSDGPNTYSIDLIPGEVYSYGDTDFCYVGNTGRDPFNNLCLLLNNTDRQGRLYFIEWNSWFYSEAIRLHKDIKEYIIEKNLVEKTIKSLMKVSFSEIPTTKVRKMAYNLRDRLINDPDIKMIIDANKYNL
jgi:hypothetical protein